VPGAEQSRDLRDLLRLPADLHHDGVLVDQGNLRLRGFLTAKSSLDVEYSHMRL
jgi:hypothetical protein